MRFEEKLLKQYGARRLRLKKNAFIFKEGEAAQYFYQVEQGRVKMNEFTEDKREYIIRIFGPGESFGEPPLLGGFLYPANAVSMEAGSVWQLPVENFKQLLKDHPEELLDFTIDLSRRLAFKTSQLLQMSAHKAEERVLHTIDFYGRQAKLGQAGEYKVPFTRQQLADMTGLRVETVIRVIKNLEEKGHLRIQDRKVFRNIEASPNGISS